MNLEDVIDPEYGLQQDDYSLSGVVFGDEGQLSVVGWSGKKNTHKLYILKCNKCSQDSKLFGDGYFSARKSSLTSNCLPCGCRKRPRPDANQYEDMCKDAASKRGYEFRGYLGEWLTAKTTRVSLSCEQHGTWDVVVASLVKGHFGCSSCSAELASERNKKPDSEMVASFFASGAFHPETKFWRSDRRDKDGRKIYWFIFCPECKEQGEASSSSLQKGSRPCACSKQRQQYAYINYIIDMGNHIAIKFGIARDSNKRTKEQNTRSAYEIKSYLTCTFPSVESCKAAERECKETLECGVVLKRDMPDGYTETTWLYNLEKVKAIYEKHGGVVKES